MQNLGNGGVMGTWVKSVVESAIPVWTVVQTVLTATFNSNGNRQSSTPTKSIPLNWSKKVPQLITSTRIPHVPNLVRILPLRASAQMGEIQQKTIFINTFFSRVRVQVRRVNGFLRATAQKTWNHVRTCLLGVWTMTKVLGVKTPKTETVGAWTTKNYKSL